MAYRGEDASRTPANWGHEPPRPASPASGQGNADAWTDGAQPGYGNGGYDDYASDGTGYAPGSADYASGAADYNSGGPGYGYQNADGYGYPQQEPGRGPEAPYGQHDPYGSAAPYSGAGGYDDRAGYDSAGYDQSGGYRGTADYGYQQPPAGPGGYGQQPGYDQSHGQQDYGQQDYGHSAEPGYGMQGGGPQGYQAAEDGSGAWAGYPAQPGGGSGGYARQDAGNDWYGGQPAAASGASFADTGTYALNGRIIEEYGTGPREAMRGPAQGYPPGRGQPPGPGQMQLPGPARPVVSGPQEQYGDYDPYTANGLGQQGDYPTTVRNPGGGYPAVGRSPSGGYPAGGRNPSGAYPAADRHPSGEYPTTLGGYDNGYGQADSYRQTGGQSYDDYGGPAGYPPAPGGDYQGGYDDYAAGADLYQDPYEDEAPGGPGGVGRGKTKQGGARKGAGARGSAVRGSAVRGGGNGRGGRPAARGPRRRRPLGLVALAVAVVLVAGAAAYVFLIRPHAATKTGSTAGPLPTAGSHPSAQACVKVYGPYCHIEARADDPAPLTVAELFPPVVDNETNGHTTSSYTLVTTKVDTKCSSAVIGSNLITELTDGRCSQVLRASYVSGNGQMMGTIGVINLQTTNEAHYAGKVVDQNNFIAPLAASKGVAKKLGQGTGVVEAEFKGHYLILTWSEFVNGTSPSTTAQDNQLEKFNDGVVQGTANISLSQRMVTGDAPSPGATA